ncbi:MAG: class I tRNA ligase family protein, partial [Gammaproteobacteria bacterium]|nr:class I tRNA ligase family protein [Gammaproteobacteria bacterium]
MIMFGMKFMDGQIPFKDIYIHGLVRDSHGQKMSKSKGNVLDPIDLIDGIELEALVAKRTANMMQPELAKKIEKQTREEFPDGIPAFGTDALRYTFASLASTGRDINFDLNRVEGYRNFCNKIWNASRFVLMNVAPGEQLINVEGADCGQNGEPVELSTADRWIISRLQKTEAEVNRAIDNYRFDLAAQAIYEFTWDNYCSWYLELTKPLLNSDESSAESKRGTRRTLVRVLETILRLTHPIMPYITEEIWQQVAQLAGKEGDTIMLQPFPEADESKIDSDAEAQMEWVMEFIVGVRQIRSGMNIKPGQPLPVLIQNGSAQDQQWLAANEQTMLKLARLESITWLNAGDDAPESATSLVGEMKVLVPMAGLIDKDAELARLDKQIDQLTKETQRLSGKLNNEKFVGKAPEAVVAKEREKLADAEGSLAQLNEQRERIANM